jgi:cytochrome P450
MTQLMGQNMMRKDGTDHQRERHAIFPTVSPKTVRDVWKAEFVRQTHDILDRIAGQADIDVVNDFAMPVSAEALKSVTGLTNMDWREMDRVSQGMIDGCANYTGNKTVEAHCHDCTASIDRHISERMGQVDRDDFPSLLSIQRKAGFDPATISANIKLAISGGQNEPRDAIAGVIGTLLVLPGQLNKIRLGQATWMHAFEEYARWMSPIGMSPRRIAQPHTYAGFEFQPEDRVFFMFSSANRDEDHFENSDQYDITRDVGPAISFGAGPHFCAGAWISKAMIAEVALPLFFDRFPNARLLSDVEYMGWAFRGPKPFRVAVG